MQKAHFFDECAVFNDKRVIIDDGLKVILVKQPYSTPRI